MYEKQWQALRAQVHMSVVHMYVRQVPVSDGHVSVCMAPVQVQDVQVLAQMGCVIVCPGAMVACNHKDSAGSSVEATWVAAFDMEMSDGDQDTRLNIPGKRQKQLSISQENCLILSIK